MKNLVETDDDRQNPPEKRDESFSQQNELGASTELIPNKSSGGVVYSYYLIE